ncbi:MAG TPA: VOC family protein [Gemmatimonadaceae bacterium]|nr:VOC family protein [Gemmatimonadaceae bacterium]
MSRVSLLWAIAAGSLVSPVAQQADPPFQTTGAFFALSVPDVSASAQWYREKLGMKVILQPPRSADASVVVLEGGGLIVELLQHNDAKPLHSMAPNAGENFKVHGFFKSGVIVEDFDRTIAAFRARGIPIAIGPFPKSATQRANAIIRDYDGNLIQFFGK